MVDLVTTLATASGAAASGSNSWFSTFKTDTGGQNYTTYNVAIDSVGNIISIGNPTSIVKQSPVGDVIFNKNLTGNNIVLTIAVDSNDNIVVGGYNSSATGLYLLKLDSNANILWQKSYPVTAGWARDIAIDSSDNIIIAANEHNSSTFCSLFIFDTDGNLTFRSSYQFAQQGFSAGTAPRVAIDSNDNVIYGTYGQTASAGPDGGFVSYQQNGTVNWSKRISKTNGMTNDNYSDLVQAVAVDLVDNSAYATGTYQGMNYVPSGGHRAHLAKVSNTGTPISHYGYRIITNYFDNGGNNHYIASTCMAIDSQQNVFIAGYYYPGGLNTQFMKQGFIIKIDGSTMTPIWGTQIDVIGHQQDQVNDIKIDSNDNLIVCGSIGDDRNTGWGVSFIARLSGDGSDTGIYSDNSGFYVNYREIPIGNIHGQNLLSLNQIANNNYGVANNTVVPLTTPTLQIQDNTTVFTSSILNPEEKPPTGYWSSQKPFNNIDANVNTGYLWQYPQDIVADSNDNVISIGNLEPSINLRDGHIIKRNSSGEILWEKQLRNVSPNTSEIEYSRGVAVTSNNDIVAIVEAEHTAGNNDSFHTIKFDTDGNVLWKKEWGVSNQSEIPYAVAVDSNDNVYVVGSTTDFWGSETDAAIIKYDADGIFQWERYFGSSANDSFRIDAQNIAIDSNDNIWFIGQQDRSTAGNGQYRAFYVSSLDSSGNSRGQALIDEMNTITTGNYTVGSSGFGIAIDSQDNVYVSLNSILNNAYDQTSPNRMFLMKIDQSFNIQWQRHVGIEDTTVNTYNDRALAIDSNDYIYVGGHTSDYGFITKFNTDGEIIGESLCIAGNSVFSSPGVNISAIDVDSNDDLIVSTYNSSNAYFSAIFKLPKDFKKVDTSRYYYGTPHIELSRKIPHIAMRYGFEKSVVTLSLGISLDRSSGLTSDDNTSPLSALSYTSQFVILDEINTVTPVDEFLHSENYTNYLVGEVTIDVDTVFSSNTDGSGVPVTQSPSSNYQYYRRAPGEWYSRTASQSGSFVFQNSNRALIGFESDISATDVAALIDVNFDTLTANTLLNNSNFTSTGFNNLRYIEGSNYLIVSAGAGNQKGGYNFDTNSSFTPTLLNYTASNGNGYRIYDAEFNALHESAFDAGNSTAHDMWQFLYDNSSVISEDVSSYFNSGVDVQVRKWSLISMDDDYVYWTDHERIGYSEKGTSINDVVVDGDYSNLGSTGIVNNPGNNDTWAWRQNDCWPDIWGNIWLRNSNSADPDYNSYRRIYRDSTTGIPQYTTDAQWENPASQFTPSSTGSYAWIHSFYSVGRPDYQLCRVGIYDADDSSTVYPWFKISAVSTTPTSSPFQFNFEGPYESPSSGIGTTYVVDGKTALNREVVDNRTFKLRLYRLT